MPERCSRRRVASHRASDSRRWYAPVSSTARAGSARRRRRRERGAHVEPLATRARSARRGALVRDRQSKTDPMPAGRPVLLDDRPAALAAEGARSRARGASSPASSKRSGGLGSGSTTRQATRGGNGALARPSSRKVSARGGIRLQADAPGGKGDPRRRVRAKAARSLAEIAFERAWHILPELRGVVLSSEFWFHPSRNWRFDFALAPFKVAIELDGRARKG